MEDIELDYFWESVLNYWEGTKTNKKENKTIKKGFPKKFPLEYPPDSDYSSKERKIRITYLTRRNEPNIYEIIKFPSDITDSEIDNYCYDVIETEYGNMRWFKWEEIFN